MGALSRKIERTHRLDDFLIIGGQIHVAVSYVWRMKQGLIMEIKSMIVLLLVYGGTIFDTLAADPGFLSIDCGAISTHLDSSNITWLLDQDFVTTGSISTLNTTSTSVLPGDILGTLRYFPDAQKKGCYSLPAYTGSRYLIRTSFLYGNYDGLNKPPIFSLAIDVTMVALIDLTIDDGHLVHETIATAQDESLSVCVFSQDNIQTPLISALELRRIPESMYAIIEPEFLTKVFRINFGAKSVSSVRYPEDPYDRIWDSDMQLFKLSMRETIVTHQEIQQNHLPERPPSAVLKTAWTSPTTIMIPNFNISDGEVYRGYLYFAEIADLDDQILRSFDIIANGLYVKRNLSLYTNDGLDRGVEVFMNISGTQAINVTLAPLPTSDLGPIINACEIYRVISASKSTFASDVLAVNFIVSNFKLEQYSSGDPCLPVAWDWLSCTLENPPRISAVKLSAMHLSGFIPSSILELTELTELRLDHNNMSGPIPDLSSLTKLKSLHLENNRLNGSLPLKLGSMTNLQELILDNNQLSGEVPQALLNKVDIKISLGGNPLILLQGCEPDRSLCNGQIIKASTHSQGKSTLVVVGVVAAVSATFVLVVTGTFAFFLSKKKKLKFPQSPRKSFYTISDIQEAREEEASSSTRAVRRSRSRSRLDEAVEISAESREFTSTEIKRATRNFIRKVGEGTFGPVFYGKLPGGLEIAVRIHGSHRSQDFQDGVEVLSKVRHPSLVSMLGYSQDSEEALLVYEFLPGGSLLNNLNDPEASKLLTWNLRLNIALQAAKGLLHLHTDYKPPIIHRNMKSSNILVTTNFSAKVADFGLSNLAPEGETSYVSILVKGATSGYLDPEFYSKQKFIESSDVYSFGVVLLEIISGRRPVNLQLSRAEWNLSDWVRHQLEVGNVEAIVDPSLGKSYNVASMWKVADIAVYSVEPEAKHRPTMAEVVKELEDALVLEAQGRHAPGSFRTTFSLTDKAERSHLEPVYKKLSKRKEKR